MREGYFSSARDRAIIEVGGFFCEACLVGKPMDDVSPDPRYCRGCYDFLKAEADQLPATKRPRWIPKGRGKSGEKAIPVPDDADVIMHTTKTEKIHSMHNWRPGPPEKPVFVRGRKDRADIPQDVIVQWASEGMGSKAITARLKREYGIEVNQSSIHRRLQRELAV
jgi:hypothetical protein